MATSEEPTTDDDDRARRTYFGRQGSPEITVAFPFSRVEMQRADDAQRAATIAALDAVVALAAQVEALTEAASKAERKQVGTEVRHIREEISRIVEDIATTSDR